MSTLTPRQSSTQQPGYIPNPRADASDTHPFGVGLATNQNWIDAFVEYWAAKWSRGDYTVPDGWVSAKYGEPDRSDTEGYPGPRTLLAFTRYAQDYQPGKDVGVDQLMPWQPPAPDEFIEDPVSTANRVAQDNWEKQFDFNVQQANIANGLQGRQLDLQQQAQIQQAKIAAMTAFNQSFQNALSGFATEAELYAAQENRRMNGFNTQAGIYNQQEQTRAGALQSAGQLGLGLQGLFDARGQAAIAAQANPGNFVERELLTRSLPNAPHQNVKAFKDVDQLSEAIRRLLDWKAAPAPAMPDPGSMARPTAPNQASHQVPTSISEIISSITNPPPAQSTPVPQITRPAPTPSALPQESGVLPPPVTAPPPQGSGLTPRAVLPSVGSASTAPRRVYDEWQNYSDDEGATWFNPGGTPASGYAHGTPGTSERAFIAGDAQVPGVPNEELIQIHNPGPKTTASVTPLNNAIMGVNKFAFGTEDYDALVRSYDDEVYQNMPAVRYFQGRMGRSQYNRLSTGSATGAFGEQLPEAGAINYRRYLNVEKDPLSLAILASQYRGASRDLASEVSRAKARAPLGQAIQTSLIRTR